MRLTTLGPNQTEVETKDHIILFSYNTPVTYAEKKTGHIYRTSKKHSNTTSKHINKWLDERGTNVKETQEIIDSLVSSL